MDQSQFTLDRALTETPWRRLIGIMSRLRLPIRRSDRKATVMAQLAEALANPARITTIIAQLSSEAQAALGALVDAGGELPVVTFHQQFGTVQPTSREEVRTDQKPWLRPRTATAELWWYGLIYLFPAGNRPGVIQLYALPHEIQTVLAERGRSDAALATVRMEARPGRPADLLWHMGVWLATVAEAPVRLLHGRWLPPTQLHCLASRLGITADEDYVPVRSERQQPYLAFLHYLAEVAEFVHGDTYLSLTPKGWQWLAKDTESRRGELWQCWRQASAEAAWPYRFDWEPCAAQARAIVCAELSRLAIGQFVALTQLIKAVRLHDPWQMLPLSVDAEEAEELDPVAALLGGPFFWFGVLDLAADHVGETEQPGQYVRLTPLGRALLQGKAGGALPALPPAPCLIRRDDANCLLVPPEATPIHLAQLATFCAWAPTPSSRWEQALMLTEAGLATAAAHGIPMATIVDTVEAALARRLSRRERQRWHRWYRQGEQVRLRALWVLETDNPATMAQLRQRRLVQRRLGESLSPTHSVVAPSDARALIQTLRTLEQYVVLPLTEEEQEEQPLLAPVNVSATAPDLLWLLLCLYRGLGEMVTLPLRIDFTTEQRLVQQLSPTRRMAAAAMAQQVLEQLADGMAGYLRIPHWQLPMTEEEQRPAIENAMAAGADIQVAYWSTSSGTTERRITPHFIEERHGVAYLQGYCHLRGQTRVFRIDRIAQLTIVAEGTTDQ